MMNFSTQSIISIRQQEPLCFLHDISSRAIALFQNPCFIKDIGAKLCADVFGKEHMVTESIQEFTKNTMLNLKAQVQLHGLVSFDSYMETNIELDPREIHVNGEWYYHAMIAKQYDPIAYRRHVFLGSIKILHELFHCITPSFVEYRNQQLPDLKPLKETPPQMGRKAVPNLKKKKGSETIRLIGDMGFAMEELLFDGQRLFHVSDPNGYYYMIDKLYLQDIDQNTFKTKNFDIDIDLIWSIFDSPEKLFTIQDLNQFRSLKINLPVTLKKWDIETEESLPKKFCSVLQSPSVGGIFTDDDVNEEEKSDEEDEYYMVSPWLPSGRKS